MSNSPAADNERALSILIVEDEFFIAMELQSALAKAGFRVLGPVGSVIDALDLIAGEKPDAAVLDVNLGRERVTPVAAGSKEARGRPKVDDDLPLRRAAGDHIAASTKPGSQVALCGF